MRLDLLDKDDIIQKLIGLLASKDVDYDKVKEKLQTLEAVRMKREYEVESIKEDLKQIYSKSRDENKILRQQRDDVKYDLLRSSISMESLTAEKKRLTKSVENLKKARVSNSTARILAEEKVVKCSNKISSLEKEIIEMKNQSQKKIDDELEGKLKKLEHDKKEKLKKLADDIIPSLCLVEELVSQGRCFNRSKTRKKQAALAKLRKIIELSLLEMEKCVVPKIK